MTAPRATRLGNTPTALRPALVDTQAVSATGVLLTSIALRISDATTVSARFTLDGPERAPRQAKIAPPRPPLMNGRVLGAAPQVNLTPIKLRITLKPYPR